MNEENLIGCTVRALGYEFDICKVLFADQYNDLWDIEFLDENDHYHHWKQNLDGGTLIPAPTL